MIRKLRATAVLLAGSLGLLAATATPALALSGVNHTEPLARTR